MSREKVKLQKKMVIISFDYFELKTLLVLLQHASVAAGVLVPGLPDWWITAVAGPAAALVGLSPAARVAIVMVELYSVMSQFQYPSSALEAFTAAAMMPQMIMIPMGMQMQRQQHKPIPQQTDPAPPPLDDLASLFTVVFTLTATGALDYYCIIG